MITLTYDSVLSRVQISADGLGGSLLATVERSTNGGATWTTVRGGAAVTVNSGAVSLDDYEFGSDVVNTYRVRGLGSAITYVATGTAAHADNASVSPGLPAGHAAGDLLLVLAAIRSQGVGTVNTPTGYTLLADLNSNGNVRLFGKIHSGSEVAPTVSFTGGSAGASCSAQMAAFRNATLTVDASAVAAPVATTEIPFPALSPTHGRTLVLLTGWKADNWSAVAHNIPGFLGLGDSSTELGADQGIVWDYQIQSQDAELVPAGSWLPGGTTAATCNGAAVAIDPADITSQTNTITPILGGKVWLKSISRPFQNLTVRVLDPLNIDRPSRTGVFDVIGRSRPVAVNDVRGSRRFTLRVLTETAEQRNDLDYLIASGDAIFLHAPAGSRLPSLYAVIGDSSQAYQHTHYDITDLPITEVAAPSPDIVGATITWQGVLNAYATWADVLANEASWQDLMENIGDPADVIVE